MSKSSFSLRKKNATTTKSFDASPPALPTDPTRKRHMLQNYLLLWVDSNFDEKIPDCQNTLKQLRKIVKEITICKKPEECLGLIRNLNDEKAFLIVSGTVGQKLMPKVHEMTQLDTVYIFCSKVDIYKNWAKQWSKIEGVYNSIESICDSLKDVTRQCDNDATPMAFGTNLYSENTAMSANDEKLDQLDSSFMYTVLFKQIILKINQPEDIAFKELLEYCLANNISQEELDPFQKEYRKEDAIHWYTCECFLYPMLNKALRSFDMEIMMKMGFFIQNLHYQLMGLYTKSSYQYPNEFIVYRGQGMIPKDFENLRKTIGRLFAFNNFLSTSRKREVALNFIEKNRKKHKQNVGVLFVMTIDKSKILAETTPFASIEKLSASPHEGEILFSMNTVFRVSDIKKSSDLSGSWEVHLKITDESDPSLNRLMQHMRMEFSGEGWDPMIKLMISTAHANLAEQLCKQQLENANSNADKAHIYHMLGMVKKRQGEYEQAIDHYKMALNIYRKSPSTNERDLSSTLNNIALAYKYLENYSKALEYFQKVLEIREKHRSSDPKTLAGSYNNMGTVYNSMEKYEQALQYYQKSLKIYSNNLPENHPLLANCYNNLGETYNNMSQYTTALEYLDKARKIREKTLPPNHPDLAFTYHSIGSVYKNMNEYQRALDCFLRDVEITEKNHSTNPLELAAAYNTIALTYKSNLDYQNALKYYQKCLDVAQKALPTRSLDLAVYYNNIAAAHKHMGNSSEALSFYEKARSILCESLPETDRRIKSVMQNINMLKSNG